MWRMRVSRVPAEAHRIIHGLHCRPASAPGARRAGVLWRACLAPHTCALLEIGMLYPSIRDVSTHKRLLCEHTLL